MITMLPEESFNFNRFGRSGNFDHPEVRWPHLLQQDAVPALEAGRHLLAVCPICQHPWYKAGRQDYPGRRALASQAQVSRERNVPFTLHRPRGPCRYDVRQDVSL